MRMMKKMKKMKKMKIKKMKKSDDRVPVSLRQGSHCGQLGAVPERCPREDDRRARGQVSPDGR